MLEDAFHPGPGEAPVIFMTDSVVDINPPDVIQPLDPVKWGKAVVQASLEGWTDTRLSPQREGVKQEFSEFFDKVPTAASVPPGTPPSDWADVQTGQYAPELTAKSSVRLPPRGLELVTQGRLAPGDDVTTTRYRPQDRSAAAQSLRARTARVAADKAARRRHRRPAAAEDQVEVQPSDGDGPEFVMCHFDGYEEDPECQLPLALARVVEVRGDGRDGETDLAVEWFKSTTNKYTNVYQPYSKRRVSTPRAGK